MKRFAAFVALVCLCLGVYAQKAPIKVSFWYSVGGTVKDALDVCIKDYNASQSKYEIEAVFAGNYEQSLQKIISALASGNAPVLIHQAHVYAPQLVDGQVLEPLDAYVKKDKAFQRDQFIEQLFQSNVYGGKTYGIAFNCSTPVIYYNKDLFRKAGLNPDKFPETWQDLYQAAKKLTGPESTGLILAPGSGWILQGLVAEFGAEWMAKDNSKVLWDQKAHVDAVAFYKKLVDDKVALYKGGSTDFLSGKGAIYMDSSAAITSLKKSATFDLGAAPFPSGTVKAVPLGGGSLYIFKKNSQALKDGAWDFIRYMTSKTMQMRWAEATGYVAVRKDARDALEQSGFVKKDPRYGVAYVQLPYIRPENSTAYPSFLNLRTIYNDAWDKVMLQGADIQASFTEAVKKAAAVIAENR